MIRTLIGTAWLIVGLSSALLRADDWPQFRGPQSDGVAGTTVPSEWGPDRNVQWKVKIPGEGSSTPAVWGVILQFPFYAGIAGVIIATHLNEQVASLFVRASTPASFPALVATYSAVLGVLVPSGGSKWVIEAPYVMEAAHGMKVHLGWVVSAYDLGEALANLLQPFWMLPILGLFKLGARDVMGYTIVVFLVLTPVVLALVTLLGLTLTYPL